MTATQAQDSTGSEAVLLEVVESLTRGRAEITMRRYRRVLAHLLLFLDRVDVRGPLGLQSAAILEAERDVGREGSFLRCFGLDELVRVLPSYLDDAWLAVRRQERVAQLRVAALLVRRGRRLGVDRAAVRQVEERIAVVRASDSVG